MFCLLGQAIIEYSDGESENPEATRRYNNFAVIMPEDSKTKILVAESPCLLFLTDQSQSLDQKLLKLTDDRKSVFQQNLLRDSMMLRGPTFHVSTLRVSGRDAHPESESVRSARRSKSTFISLSKVFI